MRVFFAACLALTCDAFYLPGVSPRDYEEGEPVEIKVNKMDSIHTQIPYDFYSLPYCKPDEVVDAAENLGEVLSGDLIESSDYEVFMKVSETCKVLCTRTLSLEDLDLFVERIEEFYKNNWIVDNLPATSKALYQSRGDDGQLQFLTQQQKGFYVGFKGTAENPNSGVAYLNNHHRLIIQYHEDPAKYEGARIVGFKVEPFSVKHTIDPTTKAVTSCQADKFLLKGMPFQKVNFQNDVSDRTVVFSYAIDWEKSSVRWASRWDVFLEMKNNNVHWMSILSSIMIVIFLSAMVAMVMLRTLHRDLIRYNDIDGNDDDDYGWKRVHGDVFRAPKRAGCLSILIGTGSQLFCMSVLTLTFALFGFLSPANRGALMTVLLLLFVFMGLAAGYMATRTFTAFGRTQWKRNTMFTALLFPGLVFAVFFILNLFLWGEKSSGAVPFETLIALLVLWFGVSVPLVYLGSYLAFKKPPTQAPRKVNNLPGEYVPWTSQTLAIVIGGILPFAAIFVELFFILSSVWLHQVYYVFGFLFAIFCVTVIVCAEIAIVMVYAQLCAEDYHWHWTSFVTPGFSAVYLFLYSVFYYFTALDITSPVASFLYFAYMSLVSFAFFILTGTIGFLSTQEFVRKIYSSLKID